MMIDKIYALPEEKEDILDDMIERNQFDGAKQYIKFLEKEYGVSTLTVKYSARLDRMEILGK